MIRIPSARSPVGLAQVSGIVARGCRFGGSYFVAEVRGRHADRPGLKPGVIVMTQYLLALYRDYEVPIPNERTREVWAGVNELGDKLKNAGGFLFKGGMDG